LKLKWNLDKTYKNSLTIGLVKCFWRRIANLLLKKSFHALICGSIRQKKTMMNFEKDS